MADDTWLVAGLGNPGPGYAAHRHNVGQMALDVLADRIGARFSRHKTNTQLAEGRLGPGLPKRCPTGDGIEGGTFESWFTVIG